MPATSSTPSQSRPAASPFGAGVTTGPKKAMRSPSGRRQFMRATLALDDGHYVVRPVGGPGSHLLGALARANALIVVPEEVTEVAAGDRVTVMVLENPLA